MKPQRQYDIFLSYRRAGGQETALLLFDRLTSKGYRVAYDIETLRSGRFDEQLLQTVERCRDLIVVLGPGSLDRCIAWEAARKMTDGNDGEDEDDWMRREIARAMCSGVNVVPVLLRGFKFPRPETLPADIRSLPMLNGVEASTMHFNDTLAHIEGKLGSKPRKKGRTFALVFTAMFAALSAVAIAYGGTSGFDFGKQFPKSRSEIQQVDDYLAVLKLMGSVYGEALSQMRDLAAEADAAVKTGDSRTYSVAARGYSARMLELYDQMHRFSLSDEAATTLRRSPLSVPGLTTLLSERASDIRDARPVLPAQFNSLLSSDNPLSKPEKAKVIAWVAESIRLDGESYVLEVMRLLIPIHPKALGEFQTEAAVWPVIGTLFKGELLRDVARIDRERKSINARGQELERKISEFTGGQTLGVAAIQREFEAALQNVGATPEDAERISGKAALVGAMEGELTDMKTLVDAKRGDVYARYRALPDDDLDILWGKALRFRTVKLPQGALEALAIVRKRHSPDYPEAAVASMEALVKLDGEAPIAQGGIIAAGFEPPASGHAVFQLGDVVVSRGGAVVRRVDDYLAASASCAVAFYRLDSSGAFRRHEAIIPPSEPRVAWLETVEGEEN